MIASLLGFVSIVLTVMPVSGASSQCNNTSYDRNHDLVYVNRDYQDEWEGVGIESLHLSASGKSYISYENTDWKTDEGKSYPKRKYFVDPKFDYANRNFTGSIYWNDSINNGVIHEEYYFRFTKDFGAVRNGKYKNNKRKEKLLWN